MQKSKSTQVEREYRAEMGQHVQSAIAEFGGVAVLDSFVNYTASDLRFLVISGASNLNNPRLNHWVEVHGQGRVSLHIDPAQVAPLFASCDPLCANIPETPSDLAVIAGGTSTYEAAACGLPMMLITIAENQVSQSKAWATLGAAVYLGAMGHVQKPRLESACQTVINDNPYREKMGLVGRQAVQGIEARCIAELVNERALAL